MSKKKIKVFQTNLFIKKIKKLSQKQKTELDKVVKDIVADPQIGQEKNGGLFGVYVHKFKSSTQLQLLALEWDKQSRTLLMIGVH